MARGLGAYGQVGYLFHCHAATLRAANHYDSARLEYMVVSQQNGWGQHTPYPRCPPHLGKPYVDPESPNPKP